MIGNAKAIIQWLFDQQDTDKLYEIKEKKSKRSLTANAYYWSLLNQLASVLRLDNQRLHFMMLKRYGVHELVSVRSDINIKGYFKYSEAIGKSELDGKEFTHYRIYKGSSQMDSKEFAVLLDGLIEECKEQGIPTLTKAEVERLKFIEMKGEA